MQVRFKGGKPLLVGGQVAGSQTCCCENPPPPACYCPDFCSYFIEVVSPSRLAIKSPVAADCQSPQNYSRFSYHPDYEFSDILLGPEWTYSSIGGSLFSNGYAQNFAAFGFFQAGTQHGAVHIWGDPPTGECAHAININLGARVTVFCGNADGNAVSAFDNVPILQATYIVGFNRYNRNTFGCVPDCQPYLIYNKFIPLPAECFYNSDRVCPSTYGAGSPRSGYRHIQTPLDISINLDGVTVGGAFFPNTDTVSDPCGDDPRFGEDFRDFIDRTVDRHTATFRITSRPSCKITDCSCGQSLAGISLQLYGQTFIVGNEPDPNRTLGNEIWNYTDSTMSPVIEYTVWDAFFLEEQYKVVAEVFCESEPQADGNVGPAGKDAWYVIVYSDCFEWEGGVVVSQTRNTYVGVYECLEHCDKFLPFGTPPLMYLVSSVTTPGLDSCSPLTATPIAIDFVECPE